jgi:hypothetical protein
MIHSDGLRTEPGRKKLHIGDERLVQTIARDVFRDMEKYSLYVISRESPDSQQEAILRALDANRTSMRDWKIAQPITNPPAGIQSPVEPVNEQTLIGLFHELIGAGLLKGYRLIKLSATETYDGLYDYVIPASEIGSRAFQEWLRTLPTAAERRKYDHDKELREDLMVVEFKRDLEKILGDFLRGSKYHPNIKLLVAWDANEESIRRRGWFLQKLPPSEVRYYGANFVLRPSSEGQSRGILATHVLLVKRFIETLAVNVTPEIPLDTDATQSFSEGNQTS